MEGQWNKQRVEREDDNRYGRAFSKGNLIGRQETILLLVLRPLALGERTHATATPESNGTTSDATSNQTPRTESKAPPPPILLADESRSSFWECLLRLWQLPDHSKRMTLIAKKPILKHFPLVRRHASVLLIASRRKTILCLAPYAVQRVSDVFQPRQSIDAL